MSHELAALGLVATLALWDIGRRRWSHDAHKDETTRLVGNLDQAVSLMGKQIEEHVTKTDEKLHALDRKWAERTAPVDRSAARLTAFGSKK